MLEQEIIDYWTRRAPSYSEINQKELCGRQKELWSSYIMRRVQDAMPEREGIKALDIGAGPGFFSIILRMAGCEVTALDRNPAMMAEAKKNAGPLAEAIHYVEGDAEDVPLPMGSYDLIVTRNLTWTLPHPKKAYASWQRVLKRAGSSSISMRTGTTTCIAKKTVPFMTGTASRSQKRVSLTAIFRPMLWPANASRDRCPFRGRNVLHGTGRYLKRWGCRSHCMRIFPKRSFFRRNS